MAILNLVEGKSVKMTLEQGATETITVTLTDSNSSPIDLTNYDARAKIRENFADAASIIDFTVTITDAVNGQLTMTLTDAQTESLSTTSTKRVSQIGYWDLEIESAGGVVTRCLQGECYLSQEATK